MPPNPHMPPHYYQGRYGMPPPQGPPLHPPQMRPPATGMGGLEGGLGAFNQPPPPSNEGGLWGGGGLFSMGQVAAALPSARTYF